MIGLSKVLVVDESDASRETLCSILSAHCTEVIEASGIGEAHDVLADEPDLSLVLCESCLHDGDAGDLLLEIATLPGPKPPVVIVASRGSDEEAKRAIQLGAIAYLAKPVAFVDLARALKRNLQKFPQVAPRVQRTPLGTALVLDEVVPANGRREVVSHVLWDIHDISVSGAFLETRGPVRVGKVLSLGLVIDGKMLRVKARVVRVQEPCWEHVAGVGVAFEGFDEGACEQLEAFIGRHGGP